MTATVVFPWRADCRQHQRNEPQLRDFRRCGAAHATSAARDQDFGQRGDPASTRVGGQLGRFCDYAKQRGKCMSGLASRTRLGPGTKRKRHWCRKSRAFSRNHTGHTWTSDSCAGDSPASPPSTFAAVRRAAPTSGITIKRSIRPKHPVGIGASMTSNGGHFDAKAEIALDDSA